MPEELGRPNVSRVEIRHRDRLRCSSSTLLSSTVSKHVTAYSLYAGTTYITHICCREHGAVRYAKERRPVRIRPEAVYVGSASTAVEDGQQKCGKE